MLIDHLAEGLFYRSFAGVVDVCIDTLYNWEKEHPEFFDAKKRGLEKGHLFWDRFGHDTLTSGNKCDTAMYIHRMGNQFKWKRNDDQQPIEVKTEDDKLIIKRASTDDGN